MTDPEFKKNARMRYINAGLPVPPEYDEPEPLKVPEKDADLSKNESQLPKGDRT